MIGCRLVIFIFWKHALGIVYRCIGAEPVECISRKREISDELTGQERQYPFYSI